MFPPQVAPECAQPGGGSGLEGRIDTRVEREKEGEIGYKQKT